MSEVESTPTQSKKRKGCVIASVIFLLCWVAAAIYYGPVLYSAYKHGYLDKPDAKHAYSATSEENLKAMYKGFMLYHDSEGQFPAADGWMDAIENRIKTNDLAKGEAEKKLVRPDLLGKTGEFGYAMNDQASAKYKDDVKGGATTPLIFESKETGRNAHGTPEKSRQGLAISVDGTILKQP